MTTLIACSVTSNISCQVYQRSDPGGYAKWQYAVQFVLFVEQNATQAVNSCRLDYYQTSAVSTEGDGSSEPAYSQRLIKVIILCSKDGSESSHSPFKCTIIVLAVKLHVCGWNIRSWTGFIICRSCHQALCIGLACLWKVRGETFHGWCGSVGIELSNIDRGDDSFLQKMAASLSLKKCPRL